MAVIRTQDNVIKMTTAADSVTERLAIRKIIWTGTFTAATDKLVLTNNDGDTILDLQAGKTNGYNSENFFEGFWVNGVTVDTLGSGTVYLYLK